MISKQFDNKVSIIIKALLMVFVLAGMCASVQAAANDVSLEYKNFKMSKQDLAIWQDPKFQKRFVESYIAVTEVEPRITLDEREDLQKILELINEDKLDAAATKLQKLRNDAATATFDYILANIYFQQDQLDKAAAIYEVAVDKYPKYLRAWKNLGIIHIRESDFDKAIPAFTRVLELGGGDAVTYGLLGWAYSSVDNNISAESAYRMAILLDPETLDWKMGLAGSLFKQEKFYDAIALCKELTKEFPDNADLWLHQANAYIGLGKPLKAAEIYELVDGLGKSTPDTLNMLGDIYINEELYDLAVNSYIRAMKADKEGKPERPIRAAKVLAARSALQETKLIIENIETYQDDKLTDADRKELLKLQARIAVAEGSGEDEVHVLERIIELDPQDGEALILLGQNSDKAGDAEKAIFYYERAEAIEKYEADAKVRHAQLLVKQGKYADALKLLRRAQTIKPRDNIQEYLEQVERVYKNQ